MTNSRQLDLMKEILKDVLDARQLFSELKILTAVPNDLANIGRLEKFVHRRNRGIQALRRKIY